MSMHVYVSIYMDIAVIDKYYIITTNTTMNEDDNIIPFERYIQADDEKLAAAEITLELLCHRLERVSGVLGDVRELIAGYIDGSYDDPQLLELADVIITAFEEAMYAEGLDMSRIDDEGRWL